ncbi:putative sugar carrier protein A-like [Capsicum annuum]|uniref:Uncharacterized protein n=1 Tax=Capsicum annuum TaxID=4072 RepID=A0A2G2ZNZ6_CAPAN|nr:putative sugar carrier protein A-like [Capsicum annuum]PHT83708.1 hypothetical protein T459_12151 [Capsicum annuum]
MADELAVVAESKEVAEDMISETVLDQTLYTHLGKEKEHKIRDRDMDTVGGDEEKNDNESKSDVGILHQNLTSATRALTHLVDVLPSSCAAVVHYGAVSCFVARLLIIEYMDLVEQVTVYSFVPTRSLQALKKISQEDPTACLRAAALMVVISYLNFFSTGVQATQRAVNDGKTRLKIEISIPELNPAMDVYRIGMQMELIRVLALSFADDGKRVKVCVRGSMGEGAFAGMPLQLSGSQKILQFMDWGDYGALGTFVNIGFIGMTEINIVCDDFHFLSNIITRRDSIELSPGDSLIWENLGKMKYTWKVAIETLRIFPSIFRGVRQTVKGIEFYVRDIFVESANLLVELAGLPNP